MNHHHDAILADPANLSVVPDGTFDDTTDAIRDVVQEDGTNRPSFRPRWLIHTLSCATMERDWACLVVSLRGLADGKAARPRTNRKGYSFHPDTAWQADTYTKAWRGLCWSLSRNGTITKSRFLGQSCQASVAAWNLKIVDRDMMTPERHGDIRNLSLSLSLCFDHLGFSIWDSSHAIEYFKHVSVVFSNASKSRTSLGASANGFVSPCLIDFRKRPVGHQTTQGHQISFRSEHTTPPTHTRASARTLSFCPRSDGVSGNHDPMNCPVQDVAC